MDENIISFLDAKKIAKKLLDSWAYILLGLTLLLTTLSGYTDVGFDLSTVVNIGVDYVILLLFCYSSMYSFDAIAKKRGVEDSRYIEAAEKVNKVRNRIKSVDGGLVQKFCEEYREEELQCTRQQILVEAMLTEKAFVQYLEEGVVPNDATFVQKLALLRAKACKPIKLNRYMIGKPLTATYRRMSFITPEQSMKQASAARIVFTALGVFFPVSISLSVIAQPTLTTLITGLFKLFTVALVGCKAYYGRLKNMTETIPEYAVLQEDITDRLESWLKERSAREITATQSEFEIEAKNIDKPV